MKKTIHFAILGLIILTTTGTRCRTDNCADNCGYFNDVDPEFKRFWWFNKGSQWVYTLNANPNITDTITVLSTVVDQAYACQTNGMPPCSYSYKVLLQHSNMNYFTNLSKSKPSIDEIRFQYFGSNVIYLGSGNNKSYIVDGGNLLSFYKNNDEIYAPLDTFSIQSWNKKYYNIQHIGVQRDTSIFLPKTLLHTFWSKDIGLVKYYIKGGYLWELKDYEIIK